VTIQALSYGGGVQSTAMLVLAAQGEIPHRLALFSNVGDDSEHPATLAYFHQVAMPYAEANGIELVELRKYRRTGESESLLQRLMRDDSSVGIPVRMSNSGAPGNRNCTLDFKIRVIAKELKRRGATKDDPADMALGISLDEYQRMRTESGIPHERLTYPLIDLRMSRQDCINLIESAGLPVPPKSSCWFCPFHSTSHWRRMLKDEPELFAQSADLERMLNERRRNLGKDPVWLTRFLRPLDEAVTDDGQLPLFDDGGSCDIAGYCHA
jgi:hypothetical protein